MVQSRIVPFGLPAGGNEGVTIQSVDEVFLFSLDERQIHMEKAMAAEEKKEDTPVRKTVCFYSIAM